MDSHLIFTSKEGILLIESKITYPWAIQNKIDQVIHGHGDTGNLAQEVAAVCLEIPGLDCVWIWSADCHDGRLKLAGAAGISGPLLDILESISDSSTLANHLMVGNDVIKDWAIVWEGVAEAFRENGINQVGVLPLQGGKSGFTAIGFGSLQEEGFAPELLGFLRHVLKDYNLRRQVPVLENLLAEAHRNLEEILQALDDRLFVTDQDGRLLGSNSNVFGQESLDNGIDSVLPGGSRILKNHCDHLSLDQQVGGHVLCQSRLRGENGTLIPVEVKVRDIQWSGCSAFVLSCRDITNQLVAEKERDRLVTAIEQTADAIIITNSSGSIQYTNPAFSKLTGYTADEVLGANPRILKSKQHDHAFYRQMWATIRRGEIWKGRLINRKKSGEEYWEVATISPVLDSSGIITHYVGVKRDITDELKLEERLRQSQKLEAIGTLAGGIAHDFNNILYALLGNSQLALDDIPEDHSAHLPLTEIVKAGERGSALVSKMLAFGQRAEGKKEIKPLHPIIQEVMELVRASLPATVTIRMDLDQKCPEIQLDETQIHQVVLNLCTNAAHAMGGAGGVLSLELKRTGVLEDSYEEMNGVTTGDYLLLSISDTGVGMEASVVARIFEPYFTTKKPNEGTGLGLASVHGIVRNHQGWILVESAPGQGTTFKIFFPVAKKGSLPEDKAVPKPLLPEGNARVMVVDDEKMITDVVVRGLNKFGFKVTGFLDGIEALEVFREDPFAYDLVITDQTMPNITGFELAAHLSSIRPDLPIILSTGYSGSVNEAEMQMAGISHFMSKPLKITKLAELLCAVLEPATAPKGV